MIYDCVIFDRENELFDIRYSYLSGSIDRFVVIEGECTFQGARKKLNFDKKFKTLNNVIYRVIPFEELKKLECAWDREFYTRNYFNKVLKEIGLSDQDVLIVSDVDEIPKKNIIPMLQNYQIVYLEYIFCYFYFNYYNYTNPRWCSSFSTKYTNKHDLDFNAIRFGFTHRSNLITNAGWHFSYLGGEEEVVNKLDRFSESQLNVEKFKNKFNIRKKILSGSDIFNRNILWRTFDLKHLALDGILQYLPKKYTIENSIPGLFDININFYLSRFRVYRFINKIYTGLHINFFNVKKL